MRVDGNMRVDSVGKVTGATRYAADVVRPGMIYAKVLRSPYPHARIVSIDTSRARALPGVHAVLTGQDIADYLLGRSMRDIPILAREKVRFVGEKVAAVAADTEEIAEAALGLIDVEYEELPAVFDPIEAIQLGAPLVHDPNWVGAHKTPAQQVAEYPNSVSNPIYGASEAEVEAAMAAAPHVFEHEFHTPIQHQLYLEPHCATVELDEQGVAHVWASNKAPYLLLDYLREGMGLTRPEVDVTILPLGGDFGGKGSFMDIPLAYLLARSTGRPVRLQMTMTEELIAANPRHSATIHHERDGRGRQGAGPLDPHVPQQRRLRGVQARRRRHAAARACRRPRRLCRAAGLAARGAHDLHQHGAVRAHARARRCAADPGDRAPPRRLRPCARLDPLDVRLINAPIEPRGEDRGGAGTTPKAREALRVAADRLGWHAPKPANVGRGITLVEITNSPANDYTNRLIVRRDGRVVMHTPIVEQGSGMLTVFRQMVAETMGVGVEHVDIVQAMDETTTAGSAAAV
jgi:CO/xanthine dehydrogenase Mo-binding subunit